MRPVEFWLLAIFCAVMLVTASSAVALFFQLAAFIAALCALLASFRQFQRDQLAGKGG
ncbi:hypothetical protein [Stenotrophomonas sp.]|uniref:hypothetical protein n=1 Tax=Stenotrophomonas sp. TaxID=69392 RepID=UPI0025D76D2F|nr:hypothetical protein [Stenotrophomonas sp.]